MKINPSLIRESGNPTLIRRAADHMLQVADLFYRYGELNTTLLAEDTAQFLDIYEDHNWMIPEWVFHLAVDVEEHIRKETK